MMKKYLCLLFSLIGHYVCTEHDYGTESTDRRSQNNQESGNNIIYPCSTSDLKCIREFFCAHARCKPTYGRVPDPFKVDRFDYTMATSNISYTLSNVELTGLNGKVTSFYINKKTDNLVIALEVKNVTMSSPVMTFIYNRKGKEPIQLSDDYFVTYGSTTFTVIIPNIKDLQLGKAYCYAYLDDSKPNVGLGDNFRNSCDPVVKRAYKDLLKKIPDAAKEALIVQAFNYVKIIIQNSICDFGLKITYPR
uniref:Fibrohexamerin homolog1 n=1 Tax=Samia ricini TaxID=63990 RepID=A0A0M4UR85_SAMRI|nr:fibrohexamerin homolog1 [Samia ricini]